MNRRSLAQHIADLDHVAPIHLDPEVLSFSGAAHDQHQDSHEARPVLPASHAREHYFEPGPSELRKRQQPVADPKYDGVRTSRKQLEGEEDEEIDSGEDDPSHSEDASGDANDVADDSEEESSADAPSPPPPPPKPAHLQSEEISSAVRKSREEDLKKGKAVTRQLAIWDALLDARIRIQKTLSAANRLPAPKHAPTYLATPAAQEAVEGMLKEAFGLCEDILELRESFMTQSENLTPPPRKKRRLSSPSFPSAEADLAALTATTAALDAFYAPYALQTLQKWTAKIQAVSPATLLPATRNAFSASKSKAGGGNTVKGAKELVDDAFSPPELERILKRTRAVRSGSGSGVVRRIGDTAADVDADAERESRTEAEDVEVFDDAEFYQQLLRDVIESKKGPPGGGGAAGLGFGGGAGAGGDASMDWVASQKARKARKKVDTKASKGRKLRFEIHEKLQNFMVPLTPSHSTAWHEAQIDELFASLLGKGFEDALVRSGGGGMDMSGDGDGHFGGERGEEERRRAEATLGQALKTGFRVFG